MKRASITFANGPAYSTALEALSKLTDADLETSAAALRLLRFLGLEKPYQDILEMSQDEWDDFVVNNLDEEVSK